MSGLTPCRIPPGNPAGWQSSDLIGDPLLRILKQPELAGEFIRNRRISEKGKLRRDGRETLYNADQLAIQEGFFDE